MGSPTPCPDLGRLDQDVSREERLEILRHAEGCGSCRAQLLEEAPERVFAFLALEPVPREVLDGVQEAVRSHVKGMQPVPGPRARWAAALVAAAALMGMALILPGLWPPLQEDPGAARSWAAAGLPAEPPAQVRLLEGDGSEQVLDLTVGDTQVVMVFDQELDL